MKTTTVNALLRAETEPDERRSLRGPVRLRTLTSLRWLAVGGQMAAIAFVYFGLGFPLPLGLCVAAIAASAWLNLFSHLRFSSQHYLSDGQATAFIAFDIIQLCALLAFTGGLHNPFALLILAPVTIAASILPLRKSILIASLALAGVSVVGILHFPLPWRAGEALSLPLIYIAGVWVSLSFAVAFFAAYSHRVAAEAGQMKSALAATQLTLAREEQLAAIGGLAAAAAHELGTPLATIQVTAKEMAEELAADGTLERGLLEEDARLLVSQAQRCREILGRLSNRGVEGDAMMDQIALDLMMREAASPFLDAAEGAAVIFDLVGAASDGGAASAPTIRRRPEIIYGLRNFIENAIGFAKSKVLVSATWNEAQLTISVQDDGPGFAPEILARLGEPYLSGRPRSQASSSRRQGMGLGFFIAKTLLERTGATVAFANRRWTDGSESSGAWVSIAWPRSAINPTLDANGEAANRQIADLPNARRPVAEA